MSLHVSFTDTFYMPHIFAVLCAFGISTFRLNSSIASRRSLQYYHYYGQRCSAFRVLFERLLKRI